MPVVQSPPLSLLLQWLCAAIAAADVAGAESAIAAAAAGQLGHHVPVKSSNKAFLVNPLVMVIVSDVVYVL